jgi:hypothetical protein
MAAKVVCDFCDRPLELDECGRHVFYFTKRLNTRDRFRHLCKSCAEKLDMVIELAEDDTRERLNRYGWHWSKLNKARRERLGTKG